MHDHGFSQHVMQATHLGGNILDLVYSNIGLSGPIQHYSPYYSDHDAILTKTKTRQEP